MTIVGLLNLWPPFTAAAVTPPPDPDPDPDPEPAPAAGVAVLVDPQGNKVRMRVG